MKAMELKVWVDGVQRIVCGVSEFTTCQEVVIALAQAIGEFTAPKYSTEYFCCILFWQENIDGNESCQYDLDDILEMINLHLLCDVVDIVWACFQTDSSW